MSLTVLQRPEVAVGAEFSRLVSAVQALLYQFQREDFAVHTVNSDGGDARFLITGDVTAEILVGDSLFSGVANYIGKTTAVTVVFNTPNTEVTTDFTFAANSSGFINDFTARPNYFVDFIIRHIEVDGASDVDLVVNPRVEAFSDGILDFDVSPYILPELDPDVIPDLSEPLSDFYQKRDIRFFIKYRENWTGSSESQTLDSSFEFNALLAVAQIGEENGQNLNQFIPFSGEQFAARWMTDLKTLRFYPGFEFYMMFFYPDDTILIGSVRRLEIQLDQNGDFISELRIALPVKREAVNFMKLAEGYDEATKFIDLAIITPVPTSSETTIGDDPQDIFFLPGTSIGWTAGNAAKVHQTKDGGLTWPEVFDFGAFILNRIRFADPDNGFVVESSGTVGVRQSVNGGNSWTSITPAAGNYIALFVWSKDRLIVCRTGSGDTPQISNDAGATWQPTGAKAGSGFTCNGFYFWNFNRGVMIGSGGRVQFTEDGGTIWTEAITKPNAISLNDVIGYPNGITLACGNGTVWRSTDFGKNWVEVHSDASVGQTRFAKSSNDNLVYLNQTTIANNFLVTYDGGLNWEIKTMGTADQSRGIAVFKDHLHVGTGDLHILNVGHIVLEFVRIEIIHCEVLNPFYIRYNNRRGGNTWWMFKVNQTFTTDNSFEEVLLIDDQLTEDQYEELVQLNNPNDVFGLGIRELSGVRRLNQQGNMTVMKVDKDGTEIGLLVLPQAQSRQTRNQLHQIDLIVQLPEKQRLL